MMKRNFGKILSIVLSAAIAFTSVPSYAMEGYSADAKTAEESVSEDLSTGYDDFTGEVTRPYSGEDEDIDKEADNGENAGFVEDADTFEDLLPDEVEDVIEEAEDEPETVADEDYEINALQVPIQLNFGFDISIPYEYSNRYEEGIIVSSSVCDENGGEYTLSDPNGYAPDGYYFAGFTSQTEGVTVKDKRTVVISKAAVDQGYEFSGYIAVYINLVAEWEPLKADIVYHTNGGIFSDESDSYTTASLEVGQRFGEVSEPSRDGYWFEEWCLDQNGEGPTITSTGVFTTSLFNEYCHDGVVAVYAVWWRNPTHKVTFDPNGGGGVQYIYARDDVIIKAPDITPAITGSTFKYWSLENDKNASEFVFSENSITCDLTLYAIYDPWIYNLIADANGGQFDGGQTYTKAVRFGDTVGELPVPVKKGFTLDYWSTSPGDGGRAVYSGTIVDKNNLEGLVQSDTQIHIYAHYTKAEYLIEYDFSNGGEFPDEARRPTTITYETNSSVIDDPVKEHYSFVCWNTQQDGEGSIFAKENQIINASNIDTFVSGGIVRIYAIWRPNYYTLKFNGNFPADTTYSGTMSDLNVNFDEEKELPACGFEADEYDFAGWALSPDGTVIYANLEKVLNIATEDYEEINLYAIWSKNTYRVRFNPNPPVEREVTGQMDVQVYKVNQEYPLYENAYGIEGYYFLGWSISPTSTSVDFYDHQYVKNIAGDGQRIVDLYAVWQVKSYYVRYFANVPQGRSYTGYMDRQLHTVDVSKALFENRFEVPGYEFAGWATSATGDVVYENGEVVVNLSMGDVDPVSLYAVWTPKKYNVVFDPNPPEGNEYQGSMEPQQLTIDAEDKLAMCGYTVAGYAFAGWARKPAGNVVYENGAAVRNVSYDAASDVTLYAVWSKNSYSVRFNRNDPEGTTGEGIMADMAFRFDERRLLTPNAFSVPGYTFQGWATTPQGEKVYDDEATVINLATEQGAVVNLYAIWKANRYTVRFNANAPAGRTATGTMGEELFECNKEQNLTANAFFVEHYTFIGWATSPEGDVIYTDGQRVKDLVLLDGAVVELYAKWSAGTYTVKLLANAPGTRIPTGYMAPVTVGFDSPQVLPENKYSVDGYTFNGWALTRTGAVAYADKATIINLSDVDGGEVDLYAVWTPWTYRISFDKNDDHATGSMQDIEMTVDVSKVLPAVGFDNYENWFGGWTTESDGSGSYYSDKDTVNLTPPGDGAAVVLYAQWTNRDAFRVRFLDGENVIYIRSVYDSNPVARPEDPEKTGYDFLGWYADADFTTEYDFDSLISQNTDIYAKYEGYTYNVIFDANMDDVSGAMDPLPMRNGASSVLPANAYTHFFKYFSHWNTERDGSGLPFADGDTVDFLVTTRQDNDITLYAQWEDKLIVRFNTAGGDHVPIDQYIIYGEKASEPELKPELKGYIFSGWFKDGQARVYSFDSRVTAGFTLTARYIPTSYIIHFDGNGGNGDMEDMQLSYDEIEALTPNDFEKEDHVFLGWSESPDGHVVYKDRQVVWNLTDEFGKVCTLYAVWGKGITLHYGYDRGDGSEAEYCWCEEGTPIDRTGKLSDPQSFDNPGYYFTGWYDDDEGGNKIDLSDNYDTSFMELWARYEPVTYDVTFHSNLETDTKQKKSYSSDLVAGLADNLTLESVFGNNADVMSQKDRFIEWSSLYNSYDEDMTIEDFIYTEGLSTISKSCQAPVVNVDVYAKWTPVSDYYVAFITDKNAVYDEEAQSFSLGDIEELGAYGHLERVDKNEQLVLAGNEIIRKGYVLKGYEYFDGKKTKTISPTGALKDLNTTGNMGEKQLAALKAVWKASSYKITWNNDGGRVSSGSQKKTYIYDAVYSLPQMTKKGYSFDGWYLDSGFTKKVTVLGAGAKEKDGDHGVEYGDVTLYAKFTSAGYTVKLDTNDGGSDAVITNYSPFSPFSLSYDQSISLKPYQATWTGHKFKNWKAEWTEGGAVKTKTYKAGADLKNITTVDGTTVTLKAQWTDLTYTVSYDYAGGKLINCKNPSKYKRVEQNDAVVINTPVRDGYDFEGWELSQKGISVKERCTALIAEDEGRYLLYGFGNVTLKAVWQPKKYDIEFYASADDEPVHILENRTFDDKLTLTDLADAAKKIDEKDASKIVKGFAKVPSGSVKYLLAKEYKISTVAANSESAAVRLYAVKGNRTKDPVYQQGKYVITINPNGADILDAHGIPVTNSPYKLAGGAKISYADGTAAGIGPVTLPSGWHRAGYEFKGFALSKGAKEAVFPEGIVASAITTKTALTLYAVWTPDVSLITYEPHPVVDGFVSYAFEIDASKLPGYTIYASKAVKLKKLTQTGYTFLGWEIAGENAADADVTYDKSGKYVTKINKGNDVALTLRACFKEHTYRLVIDPNGGYVIDPATGLYSDKPVTYAVFNYSERPMVMKDLYKEGCFFKDFTTDKKGKKVFLSARGLSAKDNDIFTVYAQWNKIDLQQPGITADLSKIGVLTVSVNGDMAYSTDTIRKYPVLMYEVEFSPDKDFRYDVRKVEISETSQNNKITINGLNGNAYYVRVRQWKQDSNTGAYGKYSETVRAVKPGTSP